MTPSVKNIRTRPTNEIKDFEWVPRNLVTRFARNMSSHSLGALRDPPCFFLLDVLTIRPPDGQDLSSVNSRLPAELLRQLNKKCRRRLIFPGGCPPSIFSTEELNYRVRDGNGWTLFAIDTDFYQNTASRIL